MIRRTPWLPLYWRSAALWLPIWRSPRIRYPSLRRQITALSETLKTFGHLEPERDRMPAAVRHKRSKEGFRKGELTRRVLEKIRDAAEPVRPMDVARAIMVECLMDQGDQKLAVAFQHKVHNVIRQQWQRGIVERVGAEDGWNARWRVAGW